jgi:hypothetical protein
MTKGSFKLPLFSNMEGSLRRSLLLNLFAVFLTKFLHSPGGINNFLFASIEGMTYRANFYMQRPTHGGSGLESTAATAGHGDFLIVWMNIRFHGQILELCSPQGKL